MASAVFRVKRRIDDEPYDKFVLNCKRPKLADEAAASNAENTAADVESGRAILKLAATVQADDDIGAHLSRLQKTDAEQCVRKVRKPSNVVAKLRKQFQNDAQQQRYKILSDNRAADGGAHGDSGHIVIDVVKEDEAIECKLGEHAADVAGGTAGDPVGSSTKNRFVYDLYTFDSGEPPIQWDLGHIASILPFNDFMYQMNDETLDNSDVDSEDSNDEANWRNEYPDTDDGSSIGDNDIRRAVEDMNFDGEEGQLSSDDHAPAEGVVHFIDRDSDDDDEYAYFKKHGQVKMHSQFYRNRSRRAKADSDDDDDSSDDSNTSKSSASDVSDLVSCDEDDNH